MSATSTGQPFFHAFTLVAANRWRAFNRRSLRWRWIVGLALVGALVAGCFAVVALLHLLDASRTALMPLMPTVSGLAAILGGLACLRRRRRLRAAFARSWWATLPIAASVRERHLILRTAAPVFALQIGVALLAGFVTGQPLFIGLGLIAAVCADLIGVWRGARDQPPARRPLRFIRTPARAEPTFAALARWPFRQALAMAEPALQARTLAVLLLVLPIGTTALQGLVVIIGWSAATVVFELARAGFAVIPQAAAWLRATPLSTRRFVHALVPRAALAIAAAAVVLGVCLLALTGNAGAAAGLTLIVCATAAVALGISLVHRFDARRRRLELAATALLLVTALTIVPWALAPLFFLIGGLQWQRLR